jgi:hypothetical protein
MNDKESDNPSRDALLLQLLKTPPQPRAERKRPRDKANLKPSWPQVSGTEEKSESVDVRRR